MISNLLKYFKDKEIPQPQPDQKEHNEEHEDSIIFIKETKLDRLIDKFSNTTINDYDIDILDEIHEQQPQYGTTFSNAKDFNTSNSIKTLKYNHDLPEVSDYQSRVTEFYLPSLNKYHPSYDTIPHEQYEYSVDEKFKQIELEISKLKVRVPSLTGDQLSKINKYFQIENNFQQIKSNFNIDLSVKDFKTLLPGRWLNDNIIDYYFNLISDMDPKYHSWTSHFFSNLQSKGYAGVKRWGKRLKLNIFEKTLVFIPINISSTHWALAIINNTNKTISYLDSLVLEGGNSKFVNMIKSYMVGETQRLGVNVDIDEYDLIPNYKVPQQLNGYDCGVFTCIAALYIAKGKKLSYSQGDMGILRQRMALEILLDKLS